MPAIHKPRNKYLIISSLIALLIIAAAFIAYSYDIWPFNDSGSSDKTAQHEAGNASDVTNPQQKKNLPSQEELKASGGDKTTDEIPIATTGSLEITALEQRSDTMVYAGVFHNTAAGGTCSALFEHSNGAARPVTHTGPASDNTCPETSVSMLEFGARGEWKLTLRYYVDDKQLVTTKTVEVK